jgi:hypothetical protein
MPLTTGLTTLRRLDDLAGVVLAGADQRAAERTLHVHPLDPDRALAVADRHVSHCGPRVSIKRPNAAIAARATNRRKVRALTSLCMSAPPKSPALEALDVAHAPARVSWKIRNGRGRLPTDHPDAPGVPVNAEPLTDRRRAEQLRLAQRRYLVARRYVRICRVRLERAVHAATSGNR